MSRIVSIEQLRKLVQEKAHGVFYVKARGNRYAIDLLDGELFVSCCASAEPHLGAAGIVANTVDDVVEFIGLNDSELAP